MARRWTRLPWALVGVAIGSALYWIVTPVLGGSPGALLGAPAAGLSLPLLDLTDTPTVRAHLPQLFTTALVIAVIGSLESLLTAAGLRPVRQWAFPASKTDLVVELWTR